MPDETHTEDDNEFVSVASLLRKGISAAVIATEIKKGVYTRNQFGRLVKATKGSSEDVTSKKYALDKLAEHYKCIQELTLSPPNHIAEHPLDHMVNDYDHPLWLFGWKAKSCPDFKNLQTNYDAGNTSQPEDIEKDPPSHSSIYKLLEGLVHLKFGPEVVKDLMQSRSTKLSTIQHHLHLAKYDFSMTTLRKYLKHKSDD